MGLPPPDSGRGCASPLVRTVRLRRSRITDPVGSFCVARVLAGFWTGLVSVVSTLWRPPLLQPQSLGLAATSVARIGSFAPPFSMTSDLPCPVQHLSWRASSFPLRVDPSRFSDGPSCRFFRWRYRRKRTSYGFKPSRRRSNFSPRIQSNQSNRGRFSPISMVDGAGGRFQETCRRRGDSSSFLRPGEAGRIGLRKELD